MEEVKKLNFSEIKFLNLLQITSILYTYIIYPCECANIDNHNKIIKMLKTKKNKKNSSSNNNYNMYNIEQLSLGRICKEIKFWDNSIRLSIERK